MATDARPRTWLWPVALVALAAMAALAIALVAEATRKRVADNEAAQALKVLRLVLPPGSYDNRPGEDRMLALAPDLLGSAEPVPIYRARRGGQPVAAVLTVVALQGYAGPIRLLVSLAADDGRVLAVRVIEHQETPGLGARIDAARSGWTRIFVGRSLADPPPERWAVRRDGGAFDQLTGATVTSRAVVKAVRDAATYFEQHRDAIFAQGDASLFPAGQPDQ